MYNLALSRQTVVFHEKGLVHCCLCSNLVHFDLQIMGERQYVYMTKREREREIGCIVTRLLH